jgi:hypothetical protein
MVTRRKERQERERWLLDDECVMYAVVIIVLSSFNEEEEDCGNDDMRLMCEVTHSFFQRVPRDSSHINRKQEDPRSG